MKVVFIHGAWSSPKSFTYIVDQLNLTNHILLSYDTKLPFQQNLHNLHNQLVDCTSIFFVAHSLGGIYAAHLADKRCLGGVTIATPYGGIESSALFRVLYPTQPVFKTLLPNSTELRYCQQTALPNWTQLVCLGPGIPWISEPNDGVVTVQSQRALNSIQQLETANTHHDVLQDLNTCWIIKEKLGLH